MVAQQTPRRAAKRRLRHRGPARPSCSCPCPHCQAVQACGELPISSSPSFTLPSSSRTHQTRRLSSELSNPPTSAASFLSCSRSFPSTAASIRSRLDNSAGLLLSDLSSSGARTGDAGVGVATGDAEALRWNAGAVGSTCEPSIIVKIQVDRRDANWRRAGCLTRVSSVALDNSLLLWRASTLNFGHSLDIGHPCTFARREQSYGRTRGVALSSSSMEAAPGGLQEVKGVIGATRDSSDIRQLAQTLIVGSQLLSSALQSLTLLTGPT